MNKLKEYLFYKEMSVTKFADKIGASRNYISQITLGKIKPSKFLARDIERMTDGEVKAEDLIKGD